MHGCGREWVESDAGPVFSADICRMLILMLMRWLRSRGDVNSVGLSF